jgi:4-alpha-glucanotransferase
VDAFIALQFLFARFWGEVKGYANARGVRLVGDMPIYVGGQSADVWAHRRLFELTADGSPAAVSGVPPDAFSATGQLWGSPLYDWPAHRLEGYRWWVRRFARSLALDDETRVDHFRAFAGYWAVEAWRETAMVGTWRKGPGVELFEALEAGLGAVPILAEDLGVITPDVVALRDAIAAPGMLVLQFAWGGGPANTHLLHNARDNCFVYPGTHDNQTTVGWWRAGATPQEKALARSYLGMPPPPPGAGDDDDGDDVAGAFTRGAFASVARTAVVSMQDVLRLGDEARMNVPGRAEGNWSWRLSGEDAGAVWAGLGGAAAELRALAAITDRLSEEHKRREGGGEAEG